MQKFIIVMFSCILLSCLSTKRISKDDNVVKPPPITEIPQSEESVSTEPLNPPAETSQPTSELDNSSEMKTAHSTTIKNKPLNTSSKHALLIAVQNYQSVRPLKGPINDVYLMKGVLQKRFGFQEADFIMLLNEDATHIGIEKAFHALIERVKKGDFVYIHYSGHGSQTPDLNGDESRDHKDETWVSYGTRTGQFKNKDNYDVLDDEINAWLADLYAKTKQVVFVSDSCHSGTVARGEAAVNRAARIDRRVYPLGKQAYRQIEKYQGIRVGAARDRETASEIQFNDGNVYGIFTWYWASALQRAQPEDSWYDVFKQTSLLTVLASGWRQQQPQIEGERDRQVFGGEFSRLQPTIPVDKSKGKSVEIRAGYLTGVTVGSTYRLYQTQNTDAKNLPLFTIYDVDAFTSKGTASKAGIFKRGDLVIEASHTYHFDSIKIYLSADYHDGKEQPLLQMIKNAVLQMPHYKLTDDPYYTDLRLHLLRPKRDDNGQPIRASEEEALPRSFIEQSPELWVLTPDQRLLHDSLQISFRDPNKGIKSLRRNLNKWARVRELKKLQNPNGPPLPITVQTTVLKPVNVCPTNANCVSLPNHLGLHQKTVPYSFPEMEGRTVNKGERLAFTLHNHSQLDYYCYLINIGVDGAIAAIFPNPEQRMEYARIQSGETLDLIERKGKVLKATQIGEETIKIITSTQPIDISLLEQSGLKGRGIKELNPLERLLTHAMHGQRGEESVPSHEKWATAQVTFEVK